MDALNILYQKIKEIINEKLIENKHKDLINYLVDTQLVKLEENNAVITTPFEITKLVLTSNSDIVKIIKERVGMDWEWDFYFIEEIAEKLKKGDKE